MNGPEHYREAEALLKLALNVRDSSYAPDHELAAQFSAEAGAHATLALAAAVVDATTTISWHQQPEWLQAIRASAS